MKFELRNTRTSLGITKRWTRETRDPARVVYVQRQVTYGQKSKSEALLVFHMLQFMDQSRNICIFYRAAFLLVPEFVRGSI